MNQSIRTDLEMHVKIVGWLLILGHALFLVAGLFVFSLLVGIGAVVPMDEIGARVLSLVGTSVGVFMVMLSAPGIVAGYGLLARKGWGRFLAIVVGILSLINFPIGTAVGAYTIWVLFQDQSEAYFTSPKPA